jgi:hypothetical protein
MAKKNNQNPRSKPKSDSKIGSIVNKGDLKGRTTPLPTSQLNNKPKKK